MATNVTEPVLPEREVAISLRGVGRRYGSNVALHPLDLDVRRGEVHAIIGENGAGKSTCLSIVAGRISLTSGTVELFGEELATGDPGAVRRAGVASIYQELTIVPQLSTQANVYLGQEMSRSGLVLESEMRERLEALCTELGVHIPVDVEAGSLSVSDQQLVEILRALVAEPQVILFDEPTAALAPREREVLHEVIRGLRERGVTVVFISHNLDEVLDLSDTVSVFRNGRLITTKPARDWTKPEMVHAMIGRTLVAGEQSVAARRTSKQAPVLQVRGLTTRRLHGVDFDLHRGEILGIAGLVGSGRSTILKALAGEFADCAGTMFVDGDEISWPRTVRHARRAGIALVPEDRKIAGLFHDLSAAENIAVGAIRSSSRFGWVSPRAMRRAAEEASGGMGFDPGRLDSAAGSLSGGNQQKLLLARAAISRPDILLADEPTRGIDVGAKEEIMRTLRGLAESGVAVVTVSSELEDLELMCDRVIVLAAGEIATRLDHPDEISVSAMLRGAFRVLEHSA